MDVGKVIELLGGTTEVARLCLVGVPAVSMWKSRNSIPAEHWYALDRAAAARGLKGITFETLAMLHRPTTVGARA